MAESIRIPRKLDPRRYPIVVRVVYDSYNRALIEASQPDLDVYIVGGKVDEVRQPLEIGRVVVDAWMKAIENYSERFKAGTAPPPPSLPKKMLHQPSEIVVQAGEAAKYLGVSVQSVRRMCERGQIRMTTTPGGHRRIRFKELEKLKERIQTQQKKQKKLPY